MRRRLPVLVERSVGQMQADRIEVSSTFEAGAREKYEQFSCREGCAGCCHHPVVISILEGISLYQSLTERGMWTPSLRKRLEETADMTTGLALSVWMLTRIPCPLLDEKSRCLGYEARPLTCRTMFAGGDPQFCDPQHIGPQTSILARTEPLEEFHKREGALLKRHQLFHLLLPIGRSVLLAARICSGEIDLERVDQAFAREHFGGTAA